MDDSGSNSLRPTGRRPVIEVFRRIERHGQLSACRCDQPVLAHSGNGAISVWDLWRGQGRIFRSYGDGYGCGSSCRRINSSGGSGGFWRADALRRRTQSARPADSPGGGTVRFVSPGGRIMLRCGRTRKAGTPNVNRGDIRAATVFYRERGNREARVGRDH